MGKRGRKTAAVWILEKMTKHIYLFSLASQGRLPNFVLLFGYIGCWGCDKQLFPADESAMCSGEIGHKGTI